MCKVIEEYTDIFGRKRRIIECETCKNPVALVHPLTNTCDVCESDYNLFGQILAPRHQWGEETGEDYLDIMGYTYEDEY